MVLRIDTLQGPLNDLFAQVTPYPVTGDDVATTWSTILGDWFETMSQPALKPGTIVTAKAAFEAPIAASVILDPTPNVRSIPTGLWLVVFPAALTAFATVIAAGVIPPTQALPPPAPYQFPALPGVAEPEATATVVAASLFAWAQTGLYGTPATGPNTPWL